MDKGYCFEVLEIKEWEIKSLDFQLKCKAKDFLKNAYFFWNVFFGKNISCISSGSCTSFDKPVVVASCVARFVKVFGVIEYKWLVSSNWSGGAKQKKLVTDIELSFG